jgi:hypothetical protein
MKVKSADVGVHDVRRAFLLGGEETARQATVDIKAMLTNQVFDSFLPTLVVALVPPLPLAPPGCAPAILSPHFHSHKPPCISPHPLELAVPSPFSLPSLP